MTVRVAAASRRIGREMKPCRIHATTNATTVEPASTISYDLAEVADPFALRRAVGFEKDRAQAFVVQPDRSEDAIDRS